ncbi:MAG: response regulator [Verrucomicrobiota bacterium]
MKLTKPISVRGTTVSTGDSSERYREKLARITLDAFKFTFDGTIRVTLAWNGATVSLTVADTGIGIAPDQLTRIFDRFHRVPNARGRTHEGTGIGLALVQELARLHGGQTKAESVVDQGSIFTVSIKAGVAHLPKERISPGRKLASPSTAPSAYVEEALRWLPDSSPDVLGKSNSAAEPKAPGSSGMARAERAKARILLADDNADMREYVQRLLIQQGYEVTAVADGEAALLAARARPPNLVLSDVMLPNLDGIELVKALRGDRDLKVIPVVLLSARAGEEARVQGLKHGADDYLIKPFSHRDLLARLESHLELAQVRQTAADSERRERERIEFLTDAAQIGVWFCDLPFDKLEWDHRVKEHFWLPPDAAVTIQTFSETSSRGSRAHALGHRRFHRQEKSLRSRLPHRLARWPNQMIRVIGHPHFDSNGTPTRFDGISIDITSRVHAESRSRFLVSLDDELAAPDRPPPDHADCGARPRKPPPRRSLRLRRRGGRCRHHEPGG